MARKSTGRNTRPKIASPIEIYDYDHDDADIYSIIRMSVAHVVGDFRIAKTIF